MGSPHQLEWALRMRRLLGCCPQELRTYSETRLSVRAEGRQWNWSGEFYILFNILYVVLSSLIIHKGWESLCVVYARVFVVFNGLQFSGVCNTKLFTFQLEFK